MELWSLKIECCPCENCLCKSVCREKSYSDLLNNCILITRYLYMSGSPIINERREGFFNRLSCIDKVLQPSCWKYDSEFETVKKVFKHK